ncbi:MAG: hypothetical protein DMG76_09670 [Acidobacteria bacterium]|nr:MAG: hypothetical protein DMG76_09670 [Acidobacteriota bacterium]
MAPYPQGHITRNATEEIKLNGDRALAVRPDSCVTLFSRRRKSLNRQFPYIVEPLADLPAAYTQYVIDFQSETVGR